VTATLQTATVDYGHAEFVPVHFEDLDAMGVVHNARYALLLERGMIAFWSRHGHSFDGGRPTTSDSFNVVREFAITYHQPIRGTGEVTVHFWADRIGQTSTVYGFRLMSRDARTVYAEGRRVVVKVDMTTLAPSPWTPAGRATAESLLRPQAPGPATVTSGETRNTAG
jgi:acyl-CoA thioester hydrolase